VLVAATLEFEPGLSVEDVARAIDESEARVRAAIPIARLIYLEPQLPSEASLGGLSTGVARERPGTSEQAQREREDDEDPPADENESSAQVDRVP